MWQGKSRGGCCGFNLVDIAIPWTHRWVRGKFRLDRPALWRCPTGEYVTGVHPTGETLLLCAKEYQTALFE